MRKILAELACGKSSDENNESSEKVATEKSSGDTSSNLDDSEGRFVGDDTLWDGVFVDDDGRKFCAGMTINELVEQGLVVYPIYFADEDNSDLILGSYTDMAVPPIEDGDDYGYSSDCLKVYELEDGKWHDSPFDEYIWYYNPYPYAVPFGECVVGSVMGSTNYIPGYDKWDVDGDEKISYDELDAVFGIKAVGEYKSDYPFKDYLVSFMFIEDHLLGSPVSVDSYQVDSGASEDIKEDYFDIISNVHEREDIDKNQDSYTFKMGLNEYTLDVSYFESVDEFYRSYYIDSDYTDSLKIHGKTIEGEDLTIELETADPEFYSRTMEANASRDDLDSEVASNGEVIYFAYGQTDNTSITKFENGNIKMTVTAGYNSDPDHTIEMQNKALSIITVNGTDNTAEASETEEAEVAEETESTEQ